MIRDEIIQIIKEKKPLPGPIGEKANLYTDLGLDSLSFISLLLEIEEVYSITFGISEMEPCLEVGHLIAFVERKVKERGDNDQMPAAKPGKPGKNRRDRQ